MRERKQTHLTLKCCAFLEVPERIGLLFLKKKPFLRFPDQGPVVDYE